LPQALYELTASDLPDAIWSKIEVFQKKGAISNFKNIMANLESMRQNCFNMIKEIHDLLNEEEALDS